MSGCDSACHLYSLFYFSLLCVTHTFRVTSFPRARSSAALHGELQSLCDGSSLSLLLVNRSPGSDFFQALSALSLFVTARDAAQLRELSQRTLERSVTTLLLSILLYIGAQFQTNVLLCSLCHLRAVVLYYLQVHAGKDSAEWIHILSARLFTLARGLYQRWRFTAADSFGSVPIHCHQLQFKPLMKWLKPN